MTATSVSKLALALAIASPGCLPNPKADVRKDDKDAAVTPASYTATEPPAGRRIAPLRCGLSIAILSRPAKDPAVNEAIWRVADEQPVRGESLRALESNGLRAGVLTGGLPIEVEAVMNPKPPGQKVDIVQINLPDGETTDVALSTRIEPVTLFLNRGGQASGKDYQDAKGMLRVTADHESPGTIRLRIVPEIHHGPMKQGYAAAPTSGPYGPKEFMIKNGQAEESLRDLAATVTVRPGQVVAIGARSDVGHDLGGFLFTQAESNSDRVLQRVVLIWAEPAGGINPIGSSTADRSALAFGPNATAPAKLKGPMFSGGIKRRDVKRATVKDDDPTP